MPPAAPPSEPYGPAPAPYPYGNPAPGPGPTPGAPPPGSGYANPGYPTPGPPAAGYPGYPAAGYPGAGYPGAGYPPAGYPGALNDSQRRSWAMLAHLGGLFLGFLGPLIVYLVYKDRDPFVRDQSAEALNFQLTALLAWFVVFVLILVLIGLLLIPVLGLAELVMCIIAAAAANRGEAYRYPINLRFIR